MSASFSTGLCDCFSDVGLFCYGFWCIPCLQTRNSVDLDGAKRTCCSVWCCCYPWSPCKNRAQALGTFGIRENCCKTCTINWCCTVCSECQIGREIERHRGQPSRVLVGSNGINYRDLDEGPENIAMLDTAPKSTNSAAPPLPPKPSRASYIRE